MAQGSARGAPGAALPAKSVAGSPAPAANQPAANQVDRFFRVLPAGPAGQRLPGRGRLRLSGSAHHRDHRGRSPDPHADGGRADPFRAAARRRHAAHRWPTLSFTRSTISCISRSFIPAAIHLVFFVAVVKILTGHTDRDYLLLKVIAFLELLAACIVSAQLQFFRFPAALPGAWRRDVREQRDSPIPQARIFARQDHRRWRDGAIGRRGAVRFTRHSGHHRRSVLLPAAHRARRLPASGVASLSSGRFFEPRHVSARSARSSRRTCR